jgi:hypothetical protein
MAQWRTAATVSALVTTIINIDDAKTRFSKRLEQAHRDQEPIAAQTGKPCGTWVG